MFATPGMPGVDIGLPAITETRFAGGEPGEKRGGVPNLLPSERASGRGDGFALGAGPQPGQDVPGGEPADDLRVIGIGNGCKVVGEPLFKQAGLLVDDGQQTAGHEQIPQMSSSPPGLELVECLMRECDLAASQTT
ncbi:hypothetical protein [Saccharopolyspora hattusasensis]|uniref:hypothetical protein n=1 Tax=Saccharopolyspora hattusasensis TaxID=1128679 RepID=UPI003D97AD26